MTLYDFVNKRAMMALNRSTVSQFSIQIIFVYKYIGKTSPVHSGGDGLGGGMLCNWKYLVKGLLRNIWDRLDQ